MTNRELDALVHEAVFGYPHECQLIGAGTEGDPKRLDFPDAAYRRRSTEDRYWERFSPDGAEVVINSSLPHYSTGIAAAWQVVEKLGERGWYISLDPFAGREQTTGMPKAADVARYICEQALTIPEGYALGRGTKAEVLT